MAIRRKRLVTGLGIVDRRREGDLMRKRSATMIAIAAVGVLVVLGA
jgi:hypothetical protein